MAGSKGDTFSTNVTSPLIHPFVTPEPFIQPRDISTGLQMSIKNSVEGENVIKGANTCVEVSLWLGHRLQLRNVRKDWKGRQRRLDQILQRCWYYVFPNIFANMEFCLKGHSLTRKNIKCNVQTISTCIYIHTYSPQRVKAK